MILFQPTKNTFHGGHVCLNRCFFCYIVGGFNPFEKYAGQIGSFPQGSGWKFQKYLSCHHQPQSIYGCFLKWWYPQNTPKWSFFNRKTHDCWVPPLKETPIYVGGRFPSKNHLEVEDSQWSSPAPPDVSTSPKTPRGWCQLPCVFLKAFVSFQEAQIRRGVQPLPTLQNKRIALKPTGFASLLKH